MDTFKDFLARDIAEGIVVPLKRPTPTAPDVHPPDVHSYDYTFTRDKSSFVGAGREVHVGSVSLEHKPDETEEEHRHRLMYHLGAKHAEPWSSFTIKYNGRKPADPPENRSAGLVWHITHPHTHVHQ